MTTRTNPEYAAMAYRRAILRECITHLTRFTPSMGELPKGKLISEDVVREDSEVPQEDLLITITGFQQESESLRLEMAKFDFVKREADGKQRSEKTEAGDINGDGQGKQKGRRRRVRQGS